MKEDVKRRERKREGKEEREERKRLREGRSKRQKTDGYSEVTDRER